MRHVVRGTSVGIMIALLAGALIAAPAFAGPFTRLQVLLPGESAAPGTPAAAERDRETYMSR